MGKMIISTGSTRYWTLTVVQRMLGALSVLWAWAMSRFVDYIEECQSDRINPHQVVVVGHSRGGKTALWAAAQDERIAMAVSNNSGCTGASLARHEAVGAETIKQINSRFPHWFCRNYRRYNGNVEALPVDQHILLALLAPRALYVASATHDFWADPTGEYLATCQASSVWTNVYGENAATAFVPSTGSTPKVDTPIQSMHFKVNYHIRMGEHDLCLFDWCRYIDTAKNLFANSPPTIEE
ncbi:Carbohydrate esterase MZ0003 [Seminavis robusta]|uniref:(4-O-methyl)-D-glucuronate--lignin esterase n=1 Tax=Seminavis robusta TaxID=568900 RepID=A0A9N8DJ36_9STRA|nr:Carbohydrate esterase MZ0003 [Seminavis robusta]|eukprot:Sro149_g068440.1 Carbohydrate esterase MZ0003 (240) ;mRNA; f:49130-49849